MLAYDLYIYIKNSILEIHSFVCIFSNSSLFIHLKNTENIKINDETNRRRVIERSTPNKNETGNKQVL